MSCIGRLRAVRPGALALLLAVGACSSAHGSAPADRFTGPASPPPLPATAPYLAMTGTTSGWAVWPSGSSWLVLHTADGFSHVANRTPAAIETDGGLVGAFSGQRSVIAVGAHDRLVRSPVLTTTGSAAWSPSELPAAIVGARGGVSTVSGRVLALTTRGVILEHTTTGWSTLIDLSTLDGAANVRVDAMSWATAATGWVVGHGSTGSAKAWRTVDGGVTWLPVRGSDGQTVAALAPCGAGRSWYLPLIDAQGTVTVVRSSDTGRTWTRGAPLSVAAGEPAWGCAGAGLWMAARSRGHDDVYSSPDGGRGWVDRGRAPAGLTDLSPVGHHVGYAAGSSAGHATLWSVSRDGARFSRVPLPGWVATIGAGTGAS